MRRTRIMRTQQSHIPRRLSPQLSLHLVEKGCKHAHFSLLIPPLNSPMERGHGGEANGKTETLSLLRQTKKYQFV